MPERNFAKLEALLESLPSFLQRVKRTREILAMLDEALKGLEETDLLVRKEWNCLHCGHRWLGRTGIWPPRICPDCHSETWNKPPEHPLARRPGDTPGTLAKRRKAYGRKRMPKRDLPEEEPVPVAAAPPAVPVLPGVVAPPPPPGMRLSERLRERRDERFPPGEA